MKFSTFLHKECHQAVCEDCRNMAEEYTTLLEKRTYAMAVMEDRLKRAEINEQQALREAAKWRNLAELGFGEVIQRWMEDQINSATAEGRKQAKQQYAELDRNLAEIEAIIKRTKGREGI